ncbi:MAG TPA: hypothetical protein PK177_13545 [Burkholderiaceae bacterium]|nr:hypothetical protein [Burkholderiaceae bacterium]
MQPGQSGGDSVSLRSHVSKFRCARSEKLSLGDGVIRSAGGGGSRGCDTLTLGEDVAQPLQLSTSTTISSADTGKLSGMVLGKNLGRTKSLLFDLSGALAGLGGSDCGALGPFGALVCGTGVAAD